MRLDDHWHLSWRGVVAHPMRSLLTMLGIGVGIAAVVLLTAIGEGIRDYVVDEFTQFGTNIVAINPGKSETLGGMTAASIHTTRPLTVDDERALRRLPQVDASSAFVQAHSEVEANRRSRAVYVFGAGSEMLAVWRSGMALGSFLPPDDTESARALAVLGSRLNEELFGGANPLGQTLRIGNDRFRIIGVMESKGVIFGFDLDDTVFIPVGQAMRLFNLNGVVEIDLVYRIGIDEAGLVESVRRVLVDRHGQEDFTITTSEQALEILDSVLDVLTFAIGALGGISLVVGGVGVLTIMTITVSERTGEIGLLRALGAGHGQILGLFLGEAIVLAGLGGVLGVVLGVGGSLLLGIAVPAIPVSVSWFYVALAESLALVIGILAGVIPARQAAAMQPVEALRAE